MRPIGGELEASITNYTEHFTDSGRSSIRLFFKQPYVKNKKILIPDFICDVIIDILIDEKISYSFYKVNEDFVITKDTLKSTDFDILYVIHYFGHRTKINTDINDKILIEDYVFHQNFENTSKHPQWYAFNSFRKILPVSDGSLIRSNLPIDCSFIQNRAADFIISKTKGKQLKYNFIHLSEGNEQDYLKAFEQGEDLLNRQKEIYTISTLSLSQLTRHTNEQNRRKERFQSLEKIFNCRIRITPEYYSFFILDLKNNRDRTRRALMQENIFLPIHWKSKHIDNPLSNSVLSIPLFENLNTEEFSYLITRLKHIIS